MIKKIPKKYQKIFLNLYDCWREKKCLHCIDGLALAVNLRLLKCKEYQDSLFEPSYFIDEGQIYKFLMSYSKNLMPCERANIEWYYFVVWFLDRNDKELRLIKSLLKCHAEFSNELTDKVILKNSI